MITAWFFRSRPFNRTL